MHGWLDHAVSFYPLKLYRRSTDDEKMLYEIGLTNSNNMKVYIVDARSQIAAYGNRAKGGGFELEANYVNCKVDFGSIDNIHGVREAYKKLFTL